MASVIRVSRSIVGPNEADAVSRVLLEDGYLGMGSEVLSFERELAAFLSIDASKVCCVNSGTAALHLAVEASVDAGDEVLVQSLTFISSFQAISAARAVPVACEVRSGSATIDLEDAARRLTSRTRAIMPVHYASYPHDLEAVYAFAATHKLRVIEDAAHAFGTQHQGKYIGHQGDIVCFSFDGIKNITCGEGGAIVSHDVDVLARVRDARLLGIEKDSDKRYRGQRSWDFQASKQGYRYHMSNIMAAIGRVQLRRLPTEFGPHRVNLARRYRENLAREAQIRFLETSLAEVIPHIQPILVSNGKRDLVRDALQHDGIETGIHYKPNHLLKLYGEGSERLPITEQMYGELLSLPLHPGVTTEHVDGVCVVVQRTLNQQSSVAS